MTPGFYTRSADWKLTNIL